MTLEPNTIIILVGLVGSTWVTIWKVGRYCRDVEEHSRRIKQIESDYVPWKHIETIQRAHSDALGMVLRDMESRFSSLEQQIVGVQATVQGILNR